MIYVLSKLFWIVAQPVNFIVILVLLWPVLNRLGYRRAGARLLKTALGLLVTLSILPIGQMLLIPLENRFPRPEPLPDNIAGIIVLGGTIDAEISAARDSVVFERAATRLTEALTLARYYPDAKILFTGGSGTLIGEGIAEADYTRKFFEAQGLPPGRVVYEDRSRNTWENAANSKALVKPKPGETWLLITSAYHMPRSVGIFRRLGWPVIADPVDYRTMGALDISSFKLIDRLVEFDGALKEWIGLIAYSVLGRTSALFPGP